VRSICGHLSQSKLNRSDQAALHMLHCRISAATLMTAPMQLKAGRSRKIAFVQGLEWL
jgi:hypothetical protein